MASSFGKEAVEEGPRQDQQEQEEESLGQKADEGREGESVGGSGWSEGALDHKGPGHQCSSQPISFL